MTLYADTLRASTVNFNDVAGFIDASPHIYCGTSGGSADAQTLSTTYSFTSLTGITLRFIAGFTNTITTPTLNLNSQGAVTIKRRTGSAIVPSDIVAGKVYTVFHNGTNWLLLDPSCSLVTWAPTLTGFSANPTSTLYQYWVDPFDNVHVNFRQGANGTSNATSFQATAPITAATISNGSWGVVCYDAVDNGASLTAGPKASILSAGTTIFLDSNLAGSGWTAGATSKRANFTNLVYPR